MYIISTPQERDRRAYQLIMPLPLLWVCLVYSVYPAPIRLGISRRGNLGEARYCSLHANVARNAQSCQLGVADQTYISAHIACQDRQRRARCRYSHRSLVTPRSCLISHLVQLFPPLFRVFQAGFRCIATSLTSVIT